MKYKKMVALMLAGMLAAAAVGGCTPMAEEESAVEEPTVEEETVELPAIPEADKDYVVRIGYYNCDHMTAAPIALAAGLYEKYGLTTEVVGNGNVPQAMTAGQMDAGYIGVEGLMKAFSKGAPIVVAADNHLGGSYYLIASNDITDAEQLVGQKVGFGTNPESSSSWLVMAKELGLPVAGSNYESFDMSDKDEYLAMKTGQLKAYTTCDPWGSMAVYEGTGHVLAMADKIPTTGDWAACCQLSMSQDFYDNHPELATRVIAAHVDAIEMIYTQPMEAARLFATAYSVPEEVALMTIWRKTVAEGRTMVWEIDRQRFEDEVAWDLEAKSIDVAPDLDALLQTGLLEAAPVDDFATFIKEEVDPVFPIGMPYEDWKLKAAEVDKG